MRQTRQIRRNGSVTTAKAQTLVVMATVYRRHNRALLSCQRETFRGLVLNDADPANNNDVFQVVQCSCRIYWCLCQP